MDNIIDIIKTEIAQDYYQQNFSNDGQRFVAWYMRNIHLLDQCQTKDAVTDGANDKQIDAVYIDEDEQNRSQGPRCRALEAIGHKYHPERGKHMEELPHDHAGDGEGPVQQEA